jgi:hypothetical protein
MGKRLYAIWSVVLVLVVSIAVLGPGCTGGTEQGTIEVKATLCGAPWPIQGTGAVDYTLTPGSGTAINGTKVPDSFTVDAGTWDCDYVSGGPPSAFLESITPPSVTVAAGETKTITLNFELEQDAWINFLEWTVNGDPWQYPSPWEMWPCEILDVHFQQGVLGCPEYLAAVNETSRLVITYLGYAAQFGAEIIPPVQGQEVTLYVVNDDCAVNKTAEQMPKPEKVSQKTTLEGVYIDPGEYIDLPWSIETEVDVETIWTLVKEVDYTKSINWFGIWVSEYVPDLHPCVLFELLVPPIPGYYVFDVSAEAEVALMDDEDVNSQNDKDTSPAPLQIWVWVAP